MIRLGWQADSIHPGAGAQWAGALRAAGTNIAVVAGGFEIGIGIAAMGKVAFENMQNDPIRFKNPDGTTGTYDPAAGDGCGCQ